LEFEQTAWSLFVGPYCSYTPRLYDTSTFPKGIQPREILLYRGFFKANSLITEYILPILHL
jgi:hypothetical protein